MDPSKQQGIRIPPLPNCSKQILETAFYDMNNVSDIALENQGNDLQIFWFFTGKHGYFDKVSVRTVA